jgi:hypothetical protein
MTAEPHWLRSHRVLIDACLQLQVPFFWQSPGTMLISGKGVVGVLEQVQASGEEVIGLEGFELESTDIHPRIDLIFDAGRAMREGPVALAAAWGPDIWLDVVLALEPQ